MQPGSGAQVELLTVNSKAKCPRQNLNDGSTSCLMLGEFFAGVEPENGDIHPVVPVHDLGNNGTGLDGHFASGMSDQRMRHSSIIVQPESTRHLRRLVLRPSLSPGPVSLRRGAVRRPRMSPATVCWDTRPSRCSSARHGGCRWWRFLRPRHAGLSSGARVIETS